MIRGIPYATWALRAVVTLGPLVALLAAAPEGHTPSATVLVAVAAASLAFAALPEGLAGGVAMGLVVVWWALAFRGQVPVAAVAAAAALLVAHVAATLLGYGPAWTVRDRSILLRWGLRSVLVWPAAPVVWLVAHAYAERQTPTFYWLAGLAAALVASLVVAVVAPTHGDRS